MEVEPSLSCYGSSTCGDWSPDRIECLACPRGARCATDTLMFVPVMTSVPSKRRVKKPPVDLNPFVDSDHRSVYESILQACGRRRNPFKYKAESESEIVVLSVMSREVKSSDEIAKSSMIELHTESVRHIDGSLFILFPSAIRAIHKASADASTAQSATTAEAGLTRGIESTDTETEQ